jgi:mannose-1-phosphate guanylyltransferase
LDAIVLVGGQGTRLRPLTSHRHKSLVPVRNRPAIEYLFSWLESSGFERVVLAIGQDNDDLADAYRAGRPGGMQVTLVEEHERLESGGAIRNAVHTAGIEGRFAVLNGDVFVDFPFGPVLDRHDGEGADLTLVLYEVADPSSFGVAVVDEEDIVTGFVEKPPPGTEPSRLVNAGVWIFEPGLVDEIPPGAVRVEETLFPSLVARQRRVLGQRVSGIWADIGTPARYLALNCALLARDERGSDIDGAAIEASATVREASLGAATTVEAGAVVERSVLWEGVRVGAGASVEDSILADGVVVGAGARLAGVVAGRGAAIAPGAAVSPGTLIEAGGRYDGNDDR